MMTLLVPASVILSIGVEDRGRVSNFALPMRHLLRLSCQWFSSSLAVSPWVVLHSAVLVNIALVGEHHDSP